MLIARCWQLDAGRAIFKKIEYLNFRHFRHFEF
jgi:hypothetical protein